MTALRCQSITAPYRRPKPSPHAAAVPRKKPAEDSLAYAHGDHFRAMRPPPQLQTSCNNCYKKILSFGIARESEKGKGSVAGGRSTLSPATATATATDQLTN